MVLVLTTFRSAPVPEPLPLMLNGSATDKFEVPSKVTAPVPVTRVFALSVSARMIVSALLDEVLFVNAVTSAAT